MTVGLFFSTIKAPVLASAVMVSGLTGFRAVFPMEMIPALITGCVAGAPLYLLGLMIFPSDRKELLNIVMRPKSALQSFRLRPEVPAAEQPALPVLPAQTLQPAHVPASMAAPMPTPRHRSKKRRKRAWK